MHQSGLGNKQKKNTGGSLTMFSQKKGRKTHHYMSQCAILKVDNEHGQAVNKQEYL